MEGVLEHLARLKLSVKVCLYLVKVCLYLCRYADKSVGRRRQREKAEWLLVDSSMFESGLQGM